MRKIFTWMFWLFFNLGLLAALGVSYLFYINSKDLPSYEQLEVYQPPIVTRFYASDGKLLEEYAKEHRLFLPIETMPKLLINAFIAAEDQNFYTHPGIDFSGILRSAIKNAISAIKGKKSLVGGSTITQQVVKNFLLYKEKSINRKVKEAILSFRVTNLFSKDKILELYLNQIYLGSRSYGVASAAIIYFNKSVTELTTEEVAFLAALPQAPSSLNPNTNPQRILARRNWVIERMYQEGFITREQGLEALVKPIKLYKRERDTVVKADFFAEAVRQKIAKMYGPTSLYEGGLMVRTSLNPKLQLIAEKSLREGLVNYDKRKGYRGPIAKINLDEDWKKQLTNINLHGMDIKPWRCAVIIKVKGDALSIGLSDGSQSNIDISGSKWALAGRKISKVFTPGDVIIVSKNIKSDSYNLKQIPKVNGSLVAMDPHTGRVLALVGGYSFDNSKFNRSTQAYRQPGSSFKPFVYLAALENGITPASMFDDSPMELEQGPGLPTWKPKNYYNDFLGPITFRRGLELSRNPITVQVAQAIGIDKVSEIAKRFGIDDNPLSYYSMVLGAMETTPLRLTNAYAIIANGGKKITPSLIDKIQDRNGKLIYSNDHRACINCVPANKDIIPYIQDSQEYVTDPRSAYQLTSILEGVIQHTKTSAPVRALKRTIAGKTGTTNDSKDVWFVGYTPDLVVSVYIGYDDPKGLGQHESGGRVSQPVFVNFMKEALVDYPDKPFKMPEGLKLVKINYFTGEPTASQVNSFYEAFKRKNYNSQIYDKKVYVESDQDIYKPEIFSPITIGNSTNSSSENDNPYDDSRLESIQEEGLY